MPSDLGFISGTHFSVVIETGNDEGDDTGSNVGVTFYGKSCITGYYELDNRHHNDFERGQLSIFRPVVLLFTHIAVFKSCIYSVIFNSPSTSGST